MIKLKENDLKFAKVKPNAIIPTRREEEDAGYDIYADFEDKITGCKNKDHAIFFNPHETRVVPTGIACALHPSKFIQICERGSTGTKGIKVSAGILDSSYRGEIFVAITNANDCDLVIADRNIDLGYRSDRKYILYPTDMAIAQLIVHEVPVMDIEEISYEELKQIPSYRGIGSLGSSGK